MAMGAGRNSYDAILVAAAVPEAPRPDRAARARGRLVLPLVLGRPDKRSL